jgi:CorA-like Mg2+ transporter protein
MYKSVGIRDSRHSLQLSTSMWRLSWITFIFLPLTFLSGFFGMNVTTFQNTPGFPAIWWYFVFAIPLMLLVLISVNLLRSMVDMRREAPLRRSTYETIYMEFTMERPDLWSRAGPRLYVKAKGIFSKLKWRVVRYWFDPKRTIAVRSLDNVSDLGFWARFKHWLASYWLNQIRTESDTDPLIQAELGSDENGNHDAIFELVGTTTPVVMAEGSPDAAIQIGRAQRKELTARRSRSSRGSSGSDAQPNLRTGSPGSGSVMVEEEEQEDGNDESEESNSPDNDDDLEWNRGRLGDQQRDAAKTQREPSPRLLGIPTASKQTVSTSSSGPKGEEKSTKG